jgi:LacI family transcriptional regulator
MRKSSEPRAPFVGIATEGISTYGRSVLRGVIRYANIEKRWILHDDMWRASVAVSNWPQCDGVVIAGVRAEVVEYVRSRSRHAVTCSSGVDPALMPVVALDNEAAGAMAAEHLMYCGLKRFAFCGEAAGHQSAVSRLAGFRRTLEGRGFRCDASWGGWPSPLQLLTHAHHRELIGWLESLPKPVGIMAVDDAVARDLSVACRTAKIGVPDYVAIVGVNNDDLLCESAWPPISSVHVDFSRMGYFAAKILDRLMAGEKLEPEERHILIPPIQVVKRVSTDVLAVDNLDLADAIRFIRQHACDPCTVSDVLQAVPVGRRWLERQFAAQLGRSPHDEIARVRVEAARRMLQLRDLSIAEIAERCGFSAIRSFDRFFQEAAGLTPSAYRRKSLAGAAGAGTAVPG